MKSYTKRVVISAVNFSEGGPLTVLRDCLSSAASALPSDWLITALVHDKSLINVPGIELFEFPRAKRSWFYRLWLEWFGFRRFMSNTSVDLWLSLHDVTPRVLAKQQAVYCHNPAPFYRLSFREAKLEPKLLVFNLFYGFLYRFFIQRNRWVIVQQNWIRREFIHRFGQLPIVVAYPETKHSQPCRVDTNGNTNGKLILLYPTFPRVFKNIETILEAMQRLASAGQVGKLELRVTLSGDENAYARWLFSRFRQTEGVKFIGRQTSVGMDEQYRIANVVVFPSKLETWGLPISEAKAMGKILLVSDLPYAHETVGSYDRVSFLPVNDTEAWANAFLTVAAGEILESATNSPSVPSPFASSWTALWGLLIKEL